MTIKEIFDKAEGGALTWEQFQELSKNAKFFDLNDGEFMSKFKHQEELDAKGKEIESLNDTIKKRDKDLSALKEKLTAAGEDATKLDALTKDLADLQAQYDADKKAHAEQLQAQSYKFACAEFANTLTFTSSAAKRDFTKQMVEAQLKMKGETILGADDFRKAYADENTDAFVVEVPPEDGNGLPEGQHIDPKPSFAAPTQGTEPKGDVANEFTKAFNFTPLHPMPKEN